jgi:hypothetical protein
VSAYPSKSVELLAELADEVCGVVRIVRGDQGLCLVCCGHLARVVFLEGAVNNVAPSSPTFFVDRCGDRGGGQRHKHDGDDGIQRQLLWVYRYASRCIGNAFVDLIELHSLFVF